MKLLRKHRTQRVTLLDVDGLAPTNTAAEREIRPAVVVRQTSGGNRSDRGGAHARGADQRHSDVSAAGARLCRDGGRVAPPAAPGCAAIDQAGIGAADGRGARTIEQMGRRTKRREPGSDSPRAILNAVNKYQ